MNLPAGKIIEEAAQLLRNGRLVAFPTETVYGLGANACDPAAVSRIFEAKGRPVDHPLIVHLHCPDKLDFWAKDIPDAAWKLAGQFWPGPLTLILKRRHAPLQVTGGQETVALRIPSHPVALALLEAFGGGVAAPSANRFGRISPTTAKHVHDELQGLVDLIVDGGPCAKGVESTIISLADGRPRLLRPGSVTLSALQESLGEELATSAPGEGIRAPGMLKSHYAPRTRLEVWEADKLKRRGDELAESGIRTAMIFMGEASEGIGQNPMLVPFPMPTDPEFYAQKLYAVLREHDNAGFDVLLAERPPNTEAWQAVNDRLSRAGSGCGG